MEDAPRWQAMQRVLSLVVGVGLEQGLQVSSTFDQKERLETC